jgi:hypothetical protein
LPHFQQGKQVPKEYSSRHHYEILHKDKFGVLEVKLMEDKLRNIKTHLHLQQNIFTAATKSSEAAVHASFDTSQIIANKLMYSKDSRNASPRK